MVYILLARQVRCKGSHKINNNDRNTNMPQTHLPKKLSPEAQSSNHIVLIEPAVFYANPETMDSNTYQHQTDEAPEVVYKKALAEFQTFRELLLQNGVAVTTLFGSKHCPDHIFPNWISTHRTENGQGVIYYPMLNENRQKERTPEIRQFFERHYDLIFDMSEYEKDGRCLEANGSLCLDRANKVAFAALSMRTDEGLARKWADKTGYELITFSTKGPDGKPVYHTDLVMWIGTDVAAICAEAIDDADRERVLERLNKGREVVELTAAQMNSFCGNSLEVQSIAGDRMLAMSSAAYDALTPEQLEVLGKHYTKLLHSPIPTIEQHGGGSARCLMLEMF